MLTEADYSNTTHTFCTVISFTGHVNVDCQSSLDKNAGEYSSATDNQIIA